jgi:hypothetical protein
VSKYKEQFQVLLPLREAEFAVAGELAHPPPALMQPGPPARQDAHAAKLGFSLLPRASAASAAIT